MAVPFELIIFIIGLFMVFVGWAIKKLHVFKILGGILFLVLCVVILKDGISTVNNLTSIMIASICFGLGAIALIVDNFSEDKPKEEGREEVDLNDGRFHG